MKSIISCIVRLHLLCSGISQRPNQFIFIFWVVLIVLPEINVVNAAETNLVANGTFESYNAKNLGPDYWNVAGNAAIKQKLSIDKGRHGETCALLECTLFSGDGPDYHVMLCQVGKVGLEKGRWYKLTFWSKAEGIRGGAVDAAIVNTKIWGNAGLADVFTPGTDWRQFEMIFRGKMDLPSASSRLQFWFKGTGKLWFSDMVLTETVAGIQWYPQISTTGVKNFIPNSSFECGSANWGSYTYGLSGWAGNLYQLEGRLVKTNAKEGKQCLEISLSTHSLPVYYFDYYEPIRLPVRRVLAANRGWFKVVPGETLTLSAFLKSDIEKAGVQMGVIEAPERLSRKQVIVGKEWTRQEFSFSPSQPYLFIAIGLDLDACGADSASLWIDAVQLERGSKATVYEPRQQVEAFIETSKTSNIFTNSADGLSLVLNIANHSDQVQPLKGVLEITDFFDRTAVRREPSFQLASNVTTNVAFLNICKGKEGYFGARWTTLNNTQFLRCAVIEPLNTEPRDSPLGFNHAYPWDFLVSLARQAGVVWWRDWSAKWQTVEPVQGRFDFEVPDIQITRLLGMQCEVEVLLPFPSTKWSTTASTDQIEKAAGNNSYLRDRLPLAFAPKNLTDFCVYAAKTATRYNQAQPRPVTHFQILNEPVYTDYSLPRQFGYSIDDYIKFLEEAYISIKRAVPSAKIVGGISAGIDSGLTRQFIEKGGLHYLDVVDLHIYDPARPVESYEESLASLEKLMKANGGPKPVWVTEWGCYADDDPPCIPQTVGDETMNRCRWPSERAATEHIVKFTALSFAHGIRKLFFHAGTCGAINGPDAGGVLFEYGGTPRKMYSGVAALTRFLGVPDESIALLNDDQRIACVFRSQGKYVSVTWRKQGREDIITLKPSDNMTAFDVMGNKMVDTDIKLENSPIYLISNDKRDFIKYNDMPIH